MIVKLGARIKLVRDVGRFPFFIARAGSTGTIVHQADGVVHVEKLPNCEKWSNEIVWNNLDEFKDDVVNQAPPGFSGDVGV